MTTMMLDRGTQHCTHILIVEDEAIARRALSSLLRGHGYNVMSTGTAEHAIDLLDQITEPTVALVDLDLPGINGLELIKVIRATCPHIIPILITATNSERLLSSIRICPVGYIRKPVDIDHLLHVLDERMIEPLAGIGELNQ